MSADFFSMALTLSPDDAKPLLAALAGSEVEYNGNICCDTDLGVFMEALGDDPEDVSMCPNFPAFVAIDRFAAQPAGIRFLEHRAYRWISPSELQGWTETVDALAKADLSEAVAMVERGYNGVRDITQGLTVLRCAVTRARAAGHGILLVCMPM